MQHQVHITENWGAPEAEKESWRLQIALTTYRRIPIYSSVSTFLPTPVLWTILHYLEVMEGWIGRFGDELEQIEEMLNENNRHTLLSYRTFATSFYPPATATYPTSTNITLAIRILTTQKMYSWNILLIFVRFAHWSPFPSDNLSYNREHY